MRLINVWTRREQADALAAAVRAAKEEERTWLAERRAQVRQQVARERLTAAEEAHLLDEVAREFTVLRDAGVMRGTRTAMVLPSLREILAERGWVGRRWRPVPPQRGGRPWGTHDAGWDARVALYLPDDIGELLVRACYWTSQPAVVKLRAWYDQFGDHWRGHRHNPNAQWRGVGPSSADLQRRADLIAQVVTTGAVLREAISRALADCPVRG